MAYIGKQPTIGNFQVCDAISVVNGQAAYTMQVSSVNVSPESANHMLVSLNGILQKPGSSFTVSGSTITFASNLVTGDVIDFIQILGNVLDLGVPSDATVSTAKIVDGAVTSAKLDSGVALGKILQVVSTQITASSTVSVSTAGTFVDVSGFSAAITPSSTSNKIIVSAMIGTASNTSGGHRTYFKFLRGSTAIGLGDASGSRYRSFSADYVNDSNRGVTLPFIWYDSPSSTSEQTYKLQVTSNSNSQTVYMNQVVGTADDCAVLASQIILMEVAG